MLNYWIIKDNKIIGKSDSDNTTLPTEFTLVLATVEGERENFYVLNGEVVQKPPKPSDTAIWNETDWIEPPVYIPKFLDWNHLESNLTGSSAWAKAYAASELTLKANSAFTTLLAILTSTRQTVRLIWAIAKLREAMLSIPEIGDFTKEEIASINNKLKAANFPDEVLLH